MNNTHQKTWTLSEVARALNVDQYRLIYFCEERVIYPLADAVGRGSSRLFSARNVLEFSLALTLADSMLPVAAIAAILHALRQFDGHLAKLIPNYRLPESLRLVVTPELHLILSDARLIYFALYKREGTCEIHGGLDLFRLIMHVDPPLFGRVNLPRLALMMKTIQQANDDLSTYLRKRIPEAVRTAIMAKAAKEFSDRSQSSLVDQLNELLLRDPKLYHEKRLTKQQLRPDTRELIERNYRGDGIVFINRLLLHLEYPEELGLSRRIREWREMLVSARTGPVRKSRLLGNKRPTDQFGPEGSQWVRLEINVSRIAQNLPLVK